MYYTGASDVHWKNASIGVATSNDGLTFTKRTEVNPIIQFGNRAVTPTVFKAGSYYYIIFAFLPESAEYRRIGIAFADDPLGPWQFIGELIRPKTRWEGDDIDLGPSIARISDEEFLVYYSNVSNKGGPLSLILGPKYWLRCIGILRVRVKSPSHIEATRFEGNPLKHLNDPKGSWNESLFCPGYLKIQDRHFLFPSASTYSVGFPYRQYIGIISDTSPYFQNPCKVDILINGPEEKTRIIPETRSEMGLDTPSPLLRGNNVYLYYAVMSRRDEIWKIALTIFNTDELPYSSAI